MKVDDILQIGKKDSNRVKAAFIRAQLKKKSKANNPDENDTINGWRADPHDNSNSLAM